MNLLRVLQEVIMKKLIIAVLIGLISGFGLSAQAKSKRILKPLVPDYRIDNIRIVEQTPSKIRFAVAYYIKPSLAGAHFVGAYIPRQSVPGNFSYLPAGRASAGVPKGSVDLGRNVIVEAQFEALNPTRTDQIEVVVYKADGNLVTRVFPFQKTWKRFEVQGIKRIYTSPHHVKFQVQYFIDPTYSSACFIGAYVPNFSSSNANFSYKPAGILPSGVPKGQIHFTNNTVVELLYNGSTPYTSSTLDIIIYDDSHRNLGSSLINWGQLWDASVH